MIRAIAITIAFFANSTNSFVSAQQTVPESTPELTGPPCEILWPEGHARDAFIAEIWPEGRVPYEFDPNVDAVNIMRAREAMQEIMDISGVSFVPRTIEEDRIYIRSSPSGDSATVGHVGGPQSVNIRSWNERFVIVHELMHALGTWHEHQRPDREQYVQINYENIFPGFEGQFDIRPLTVPVGPYDFDSVMHYRQFAFATNGMATITVLPPNQTQQAQIGQRDHLSEGDILGLTTHYGAPRLGDLTGENIVDRVDLSMLLSSWGTNSHDLDGDGICASSDLAILLAAWSN